MRRSGMPPERLKITVKMLFIMPSGLVFTSIPKPIKSEPQRYSSRFEAGCRSVYSLCVIDVSPVLSAISSHFVHGATGGGGVGAVVGGRAKVGLGNGVAVDVEQSSVEAHVTEQYELSHL